MRERVTVVGGGHGLAAVAAALRDEPYELTVAVTVADYGGSSGELRRRHGGPAVGDLRRALIALAGEEAPLARALARPVTVDGIGRHPLGNLIIRRLADTLGGLAQAGEWLRLELGIRAQVLPATVEPVSLVADVGARTIVGESAIGTSHALIGRIRFSPERPRVTPAVLEAISSSDYVLLGPGSLFTSVLAVCALPDVSVALAATPAHIIWICNLEQQPGETAGMSAGAHLAMLRRHGVRVDTVLYDPDAELSFTRAQLARRRVQPIVRPLRATGAGVHGRVLLRTALREALRGAPRAVSAAAS